MSTDLINDENFISPTDDLADTAATAANDITDAQKLVDLLIEMSSTDATSGDVDMDGPPEESSTVGAGATRNQPEMAVVGEEGRG
jgi:hypothetical protein